MERNQRGSKRKESNYISFLVDEALKEIESPVEIRSSSETNRNYLEQICSVPQNTTDQLNVKTNNAIPPTGYQYAVHDQIPFISTPINQNAPGFSNETCMPPGSRNVITESQVVPVSLFLNPAVVNQAQPTVSYRINHPLNSPVEIPTDTQHFNNTIHVQSNFDVSDRFAIIPKSDIVSDLPNEQILDKVTGKYRNSKQIAEPDCEVFQVDGVHGFQKTFMKTISRPISAVDRNLLTNNTSKTAPIDVTRDRNYSPDTGSVFACTFDNSGAKGMHRAAHFQCDICGANQESQAALKVHKAIHNIGQQMETCEPNMELVCGECGFIFHNSKKLTHHMQNTHASLLKLKTTVADIASDIDDECVISRQKAENDYFTKFMTAEKKKCTQEMEQEVMKETDSNEKQVKLTKPHGGITIKKRGTGNRQTSKISSRNQEDSNIGRLMPGTGGTKLTKKATGNRQTSQISLSRNQEDSNIGRLMPGTGGSNIGRLMPGKSRQQSLRNSGENNGNGITTGNSAGRADKKSSKEKKKVQSEKMEIINNSEHDSDIEIIEEPIEVIVLDDSPGKELDEFKDLLTYKYDADSESCKSLKDTKANDRKLMEKYGLKDLSIKLDKETPNKKLLPHFEGLHLKTQPKAATGTHKIANLSDILSSDLDKLLSECGMGTKVAVHSGNMLCDSSRREDSPQPGTSKKGSDNDYRPVKQPLAHITHKDQILLAKYGIKESKVLVPVVKNKDTAKTPSPKLKLDVQPNAKPSWLSNDFDSDVSSDFELDIPSPDVDANNDDGYDADTDSCKLSVRNVGNTINSAKKVELNFGKVQTEVEVPLVPPKTADEILLDKFGIKNAIVIMGTKDVCQEDTLKSHATTKQVPKPTENKTCYKKAWQASDIKRTGTRTASHLDAHGDQPKHTPICPSETVSANEPPRKKIKAARNRVSEMIGQKKLDSCYTGLTEEELFIKYDIKLCEVLVEQESVVAVSSDVKSTEAKFKEPRALRSSPRTPSNMTGTALIDKEANCEKRSVTATESEIPEKKPCLRQRNNSNNKDENTCTIKYQRNVQSNHGNLEKKVSELNKEVIGRKDQRHRSRASTLLTIATSPEIKKSVKTKDTTNKSSRKDNSRTESQDLLVIDLTENDDCIHLMPKSSPTRRKTKSVTNAIKTLNKASDNARPKENKTQLKQPLNVKLALRSRVCDLPDDNVIHLKSKSSATHAKKKSVISANDTLIKASENAESKQRKSTANLMKTLPAVVRLNKTNKSVIKPNQPSTLKSGKVVISKCDEYVKNTACSEISKPFIKELRNKTDVKIVVEKLTEDTIGKMKEEVKREYIPTKQNKLNSNVEIDGGSSRKKDLMCPTSPVVNIVRLKLDDIEKHNQTTSTTTTDASAGAECSYDILHDVELILNELVNSVVEKYIFQDNVHKSNVDIMNGGNTDFEKQPNATEKISKMEIEDVEENEDIVTESTVVVDQNDEEVRVMNMCNNISCWHDGKPNNDVDLRVNKDNVVALKAETDHSNTDINMINETFECDDIGLHNDSNKTDDEKNTSVRSHESTLMEESLGEISESLEAEISGIIENYMSDSDTNTSGGNVEKTTCTSPLSQGIVVNESDGSVCGEFTVNEVKDNDAETHQTDTEVLPQSSEVKSRDICIDSTITCIDDEIHVLSENG